jgi:hypothetical protein
MRGVVWLFLTIVILCPQQVIVGQVTTTVRVRVVAHDAKVIGSGVGGARIIVKDAATGKILSQGVQQGGTGSTSALVANPISRGEPVYDAEGTAVFVADLDLSEPTVLEFIGEGPLGYPHALQRTTKTMLVVPGEDILGNGLILELNGFVVELLEADNPRSNAELSVQARVTMMCGCTLEPGGLWDASRVHVVARLYHHGEVLREERLNYAGEPSMFEGTVSLAGVPNQARLVVLASDPTRGNFGISESNHVP